MKYFDLFFMITYFILKKLGRDEDAAKWSAMLHTGVITAISLTIVVGIIGIFKEHNFLIIYMDKAIYYVLFCCSCCIIFYLRYFVIKVNITTEKQYINLRKNNFKKRAIKYLIFNLMIAILFVASAIINKNVNG